MQNQIPPDAEDQAPPAAVPGEDDFARAQFLEAHGRHTEAIKLYFHYIATGADPRQIAQARAALTTRAGQPFRVCEHCGRFALVKEFRSFGSDKATICPRCFSEQELRDTPKNLVVAFILLALSGAFLMFTPAVQFFGPTYTIANLLLTFLMFYTMIAPHELAHAGMARLLGGKVFEIRLGVGKPLGERYWRGAKISLRRYPTGGHCVSAFPTRNHIRLRTMLVIAAGPALSALLLAICLPFYDPWRSYWAFDPVKALTIANGGILFFNLLPFRISRDMQILETDGLKLLKLLHGKYPVDQLHLQYYLTEGFYAQQAEDFTRAIEVCRAGASLYPNNPHLENLLAVASLETGQLAAATASFRNQLEALDNPETPTTGALENALDDDKRRNTERHLVRATLQNNLAIALMLDDSLPAAERAPFLELAESAYCGAPWHHAIESTWGAALVEAGRADLGRNYLETALPAHESNRERAGTFAYIAWAQQQLGRPETAAATLQQARDLAPEHPLVRRIASILEQALPPVPQKDAFTR